MSSCCRQVKRKVVPASSYHLGPPPEDSAYFTPPVGQIGVHHPREIVRVERDYTGGEVVQFSSAYPMELEGRVRGFHHAFTLRLFVETCMHQITPRQFMESVNAINEILISAYSLWHSVLDNCLDIFSLQLSRLLISTHYEQVRVFRISLEPTDRQMILFRRWGGCSDS
jgi:Golgin subfamily A member 7/ERF4 family